MDTYRTNRDKRKQARTKGQEFQTEREKKLWDAVMNDSPPK